MSTFKHVAIVMDGNGRWANERRRPRIWGHVRGAHKVSEILEEACDLKLNALTLYTFSTENWKRPTFEVNALFKILNKFMIIEENRILKNNIKFKVIGNIDGLPQKSKELIVRLEAKTADAKGLKLILALGYGGRSEIVEAAKRCCDKMSSEKITEETFAKELFYPQAGDVDLMIRTGGDLRISNFLLWQLAYAELCFVDTKWPDFTAKQFRELINHTSERERRFGKAKEKIKT
ncbi:MAG: polyprenyl diphosphate synthase [bacterium]